MTQTTKIAIAGVNGRMGKVLVQAVHANPHATLVGALEHAESDVLGLDAGYAVGIKTGINITLVQRVTMMRVKIAFRQRRKKTRLFFLPITV